MLEWKDFERRVLGEAEMLAPAAVAPAAAPVPAAGEFAVGQVWRTKSGAEMVVVRIDDHDTYPVDAVCLTEGTVPSKGARECFTSTGWYFVPDPNNPWNLVEMVSDFDEEALQMATKLRGDVVAWDQFNRRT